MSKKKKKTSGNCHKPIWTFSTLASQSYFFFSLSFFLMYILNAVGKLVASMTIGSGNTSTLAFFFHIFSCSISCSSNNSFAQVDKNIKSKKRIYSRRLFRNQNTLKQHSWSDIVIMPAISDGQVTGRGRTNFQCNYFANMFPPLWYVFIFQCDAHHMYTLKRCQLNTCAFPKTEVYECNSWYVLPTEGNLNTMQASSFKEANSAFHIEQLTCIF